MGAVKYEYKVLEVHKAEELERRLNEGAPTGWELDRVFMAAPWQMKAFGGGGPIVWAVFRRPVEWE